MGQPTKAAQPTHPLPACASQAAPNPPHRTRTPFRLPRTNPTAPWQARPAVRNEADGNLGKRRADDHPADTSHGPSGALRRMGGAGRPGRIGDPFPRTNRIEVLTPLVPESSSTPAPRWAGGRREVAGRNEADRIPGNARPAKRRAQVLTAVAGRRPRTFRSRGERAGRRER